MNALFEPGLAFGISINRDGTWDVWICLSDGGKVMRGSMESKSVAFNWVEIIIKIWKVAE